MDRFKNFIVAYVSDCGQNYIHIYNINSQKVTSHQILGEKTKIMEDKGLGQVTPGVNSSYDTDNL